MKVHYLVLIFLIFLVVPEDSFSQNNYLLSNNLSSNQFQKVTKNRIVIKQGMTIKRRGRGKRFIYETSNAKDQIRQTYINGNVTVTRGGYLRINAQDTLIIYGSLTIENNGHLINFGNLIVRDNVYLGQTGKDHKDIYFENKKDSHLLIGGDLHGHHPHKCEFSGTIAVNGEVRVHFHDNTFDPANFTLTYGSMSQIKFEKGGKHKWKGGKKDHNMDIFQFIGRRSKATISKMSSLSNAKDPIKSANPIDPKYKEIVQKTSKSTPIGKLLNFLVNPTPLDKQLPIELVYFTANIENKEINLLWQSAQEINNSHYIIEKSLDGKQYTVITDKIQGAGNSNTVIDYDYKDVEPPTTGTVYYRLTQVDFDGKTSSWTTMVRNNLKEDNMTFKVYPNPVQFQLNVIVNSTDNAKPDFMFINTASGQKIKPEFKTTHNKSTFDVSSFTPGIYLLIVDINGENVHSEKIIVQNTKSRSSEDKD